jgi:simple sugar transport system ATP-binding protein
MAMTGTPIIEMLDIAKSYGHVRALAGVSLSVSAGKVTCVLGDNGAGKSTLIKIMTGLHQADSGVMKINGVETRFESPRDALRVGIATVYQDLAVVDLMETWRNFFLGSEIRRPIPLLRPLDIAAMRRITSEELAKLGIHLDSVDHPLGTLSGGQRQSVAIARAVYFGAKVLILDEPTAALGVKQSGIVLKYVAKARDSGVGVVFITHNPHHAFLIGDHFAVLSLGRMSLSARRDEITVDRLISEMAGGAELDALAHELARATVPAPA